MKKLLKLITMLFLASAMVISCGGGSGSDVPSTSDCTETVSTLELSDGEWTVYMNGTADFMTSEIKLEATVKNGAYEFTSGESSNTVDVEKVFELMGDEIEMPADAIENFKKLPDEQKNEMMESMLKSMGEEIPEGCDISWDDLELNVEVTLSAEDLAEMKKEMNFNSLPKGSEIKTNADKTKYTINFSLDDEDIEIIAVKNN